MRFYSYACVGAYAVYSKHDSKTPQILQKLTDFPSLPIDLILQIQILP
jgi:hypothetical protein